MRMRISRLSACAFVSNGRAAAPPISGHSVGVSTSMNPRLSKKRRSSRMTYTADHRQQESHEHAYKHLRSLAPLGQRRASTLLRVTKISTECGFTNRSTWRARDRFSCSPHTQARPDAAFVSQCTSLASPASSNNVRDPPGLHPTAAGGGMAPVATPSSPTRSARRRTSCRGTHAPLCGVPATYSPYGRSASCPGRLA